MDPGSQGNSQDAPEVVQSFNRGQESSSAASVANTRAFHTGHLEDNVSDEKSQEIIPAASDPVQSSEVPETTRLPASPLRSRRQTRTSARLQYDTSFNQVPYTLPRSVFGIAVPPAHALQCCLSVKERCNGLRASNMLTLLLLPHSLCSAHDVSLFSLIFSLVVS